MSLQLEELSPRSKLAAGRLILREKYPYIITALFGLVPIECPGLNTVGVSKNGILLWDPEFIRTCTVDETAAVLYHEIWHILRDHAGRCDAVGAEHDLFNIAGDAEINDDLREAGLKLPGNPIYPETFGMAEGLMAEEYYRELRDKCAKAGGGSGGDDGDQDGSSRSTSEGDGDSTSDGSGGQSRKGLPPGLGQKPGPGWCGSGAGHELPDEPKTGKGEGDGKDGDGKDGKGKGEGGGFVRGRSKAELDRMRRNVARSIKDQSEKGRGTIPGGMLRWADDMLKPPKIMWQDKLATITRSAVAYRAGAVDYKYERPSRRQYGIGFGYGKPILPCMRQPVPNVLIIVDTSGSMGQEELKVALQESNGVLLQTGANVQFMACDAAVHSLQTVRHWKDIIPLLKGGGGTSFIPAFDAIQHCKPKPDVVIFITDGMGDAPASAPGGFKTIWLLVGPSRQLPHGGQWGNGPIDWGEHIFIEDTDSLPAAA